MSQVADGVTDLPGLEPKAAWVAAERADPRAMRDLFGTFLTGVTVVTAYDPDGTPRGFTANSFTSVSLDPPLVLVCVASSARSHVTLRGSARFGINILGDWQREVSTAFASRSGSRFEGIETWSEPDGPPLIAGCLSAIDCRRETIVQAGDHAIVIGRVLGFRTRPGRPLGYYRGGYVAFGIGSDALERQAGDAILAGCIVAHAERVLLVQRPGHEAWDVPTLPLRHGEDHRTVLPGLLARLGIKAEVSFLYSVFQEPGDPHTRMIFRGVMTEPLTNTRTADGARLELFSAAQAPWTLVQGRAQAEVLKRFFREQATARFGIYWDTDDGGRVASLEGAPAPWSRDGQSGFETDP